MRRAFTLVELLVSITVLLIILGAVARIFSTASKVSGLGEASADLQTTATAIERLIRSDVERLNRDGFMAIQCIAVRNDVNRLVYGNATDPTVPLLDPNRPADQFLRCDQVVFFTDRHQPTAQYQAPGGAGNTGLNDGYGYGVRVWASRDASDQVQLTPESSSWNAMIRVGTGIQVPLMVTDNSKSEVPQYFPDPMSVGKAGTNTLLKGTPLTPWTYTKPAEGAQLEVSYFNMAAPNALLGFATQPESRRWTLARQSVLLADDGGTRKVASTGVAADGALYHHGQRIQRTVGGISMTMRPNSAPSIFQIGPADRTATTPKEVDIAAMVRAPGAPFSTSTGDTQLMPDRWIVNSRVDIAATTLRDLRSLLETRDAKGTPVAWLGDLDPLRSGTLQMPSVRQRIASACFGGSSQGVASQTNEGLWGFPRAERAAPSMSRGDAMLVVPTLSGNCSSFQVDWTWKPGTGRVTGSDGSPLIASIVLPDGNGGVRRYTDMAMPGLITHRFPANTAPTQAGRPRGGGASGVPPIGDDPLTNNPTHRIPWFGLPDTLFPPAQRTGVTMLAGGLVTSKATSLNSMTSTNPVSAWPITVLDPAKRQEVRDDGNPFTATDLKSVAVAAPPIDVARIEGTNGLLRPLGTNIPVYVYQAIFGFNGSDPVHIESRGTRDDTVSMAEMRNDYTPWPTALRFTMTLHDPKLAMSSGRTFQFVVDLPNPPR
jgi:prepilin-type N-terminal cleavage/methylation domain-containing protein